MVKIITVRIRGGLGNQLFTYAYGYSLAKTLGKQLCLDISDYENGYFRDYMLDNFRIQYAGKVNYKYTNTKLGRKINRFKLGLNYKIITEKNIDEVNRNKFRRNRQIYLHGYWQSESYFKAYQRELRVQLTPLTLSENVDVFMEGIKKCKSVAVHIRRGDYIKNHWNIHLEYYHTAMDYIRQKIENPTFFFFSDDIKWVKEQFGECPCFRYHHFHHKDHTDLDEFLSMMLCDHFIIANSTFSWWAAWLNDKPDKIIIAPQLGMWSGDYYPEEWVKMDIDECKE